MQSTYRFAIFIALTTVLPAICATAPPVVLDAVPNTIVGLTPPNTGQFDVDYRDPNGLSDLQLVYVNIGPPGGGGAPNSCDIGFILYTNQLFLFNDAGTGVIGTLNFGSTDSVSNSTCTLFGSGSGGARDQPNDFHLVLHITMQPFSGPRTIYAYAQSYTGANSGYQTEGTWTPPETLTAVSVTPKSGSGSTQTFTGVFTDPNGVGDLQVVYLDFGTTAGAPNSCIVAYVPYNNTLYLLSDDNSGASGPITAGGASPPLSNSQCTLSPSGGSGLGSVNTLTVPFAITFAGTFTGTKNIYGLAQNFAGMQSNWNLEVFGTWTP